MGKMGMPCRTPPNCTNLDNWFFENFTLADELFARALRIFVSVNNKLVYQLIIIYVEN